MGELNKILGRDFLIAFFLPALFLLLVTFFCLNAVGVQSEWFKFATDDVWKDTFSIFQAFVLGVFLQSINRELFRLVEGYWWEPLRIRVSRFQRARFDQLHLRLKGLKNEKEYSELMGLDFKARPEYDKLSRLAVTRFPHRIDLVLPTTFGNVVRAYEDYARVAYGFESINGWSRIRALLSKQATEILSQTRSLVDLWLNLYLVSFVIMGELVFFEYRFASLPLLLLLSSCGFFAIFAYIRARLSAERYGEQVKALYDMYLPELSQKLGFKLSANPAKNRTFWQAYSRLMVYRDSLSLREMAESGLEPVASKIPEGGADTPDPD